MRPYPMSASYVYSLITTFKLYLGEVRPFLGVLSQLYRHGLSLKIYSTVLNLNIVP